MFKGPVGSLSILLCDDKDILELNRFFVLSTLLILPSVTLASDPTPLFVIFIAWPMIGIAIVLFILVFLKRKNSLTCNLAFLLWHFLVIAWASDVGYMAVEGEWVWFSLVINISSIVLWFIHNFKKDKNHENT